MTLRIIGGEHRGRKLISPKGNAVRPSPEILREALFNILGEDIVDCHFLDLFAGTGSVGLEALSRGASRVTFIESSHQAHEVLKKNLVMLRCDRRARLVLGNAFTYRDIRDESIIFSAPPYPDIDRMPQLGIHLSECAGEQALWILQHPRKYSLQGVEHLWQVQDCRHYGSNAITFYRKVISGQEVGG